MALRLTLIATLALSGCVSAPERENPWADRPPAEEAPTRPLTLPERPDPVIVHSSGIEYLAFAPEQANELDRLYDVAVRNTEIAEQNATGLEAANASYNRAIQDGELEYRNAELWKQRFVEERRARIWDKLTFGLVGLLGIVGAAQ